MSEARRFVAISDLHCHPWAAFAVGDGARNSRLIRTLAVLRASLDQAHTEGIPWVFAGDLVHTAGYALNVVLAELVGVFAEYPDVQKIAVWGNHDARGIGGKIVVNQTIWATIEAAVRNLTVLDPTILPTITTRGGLTFSGAGAQPREDLLQLGLAADVGVYHGIVSGSTGPNGYVFPYGINPDALWAQHRVAIVGDLHHPQTFRKRGGGLILIPGSPEHHNFGDARTHGWWVVTVPPRAGEIPEAEMIPSGSPEFRTVETPDQVSADGNYYQVLRMPPGAVLPEGARAVAPAVTTIAQRDSLRGAAGAEQILRAWLLEDPPEGDVTPYLEVGRRLLSDQPMTRLRNARLTSVSLLNFCSYADATLEVRPGVWLVTGKGRDFPSNGAGKSTLFEAVFWLLFGRMTKALSGDEVIRWGASGCMVTARIEMENGVTLLVTRGRGENAFLHVEERGRDVAAVWEAASMKEMTERLGARLGITPELYQALGYFSQERLLLFAAATDAERKDMLADLLGMTAYQAAGTAAGAVASAAAADGERIRAQVVLLERLIAEEAERRDALLTAAAAWKRDRVQRVEAAEAALGEHTRDEEEIRARVQEQEREALDADWTRRRDAARETVVQWGTCDWSKAADPVTTQAAWARAVEETKEATRVVSRAQYRAESAREALKAARIKRRQWETDFGSGQCPVCGQAVSGEHRERCLNPLVREEADLFGALGEAERFLDSARAAVEAAVAAQEIAGDMWALAREYESKMQAWNQAREQLAGIEREGEALARAAAAAAARAVRERRQRLKEAIAQIRAEINPHAMAARTTLARLEESERIRAEAEERITELRVTRDVHEYWQRGFSRQGVQSLLMEEVAAVFNAARGEVFPALTQGVYDVQLSVTSRTKGGELRERTEFLVFERGQEVPYASLSGGQRRRVDVGVMLVLVRAVAEWMQAPGVLGMLVLDEVFGFLDASGAEGLADALRVVQERVPAVYAVTHDPQLQALFPAIVRVEQGADGVSRLVEEGA
jgi:AAA domain-containing protein/calcineurin-like phosphoesterase family protein